MRTDLVVALVSVLCSVVLVVALLLLFRKGTRGKEGADSLDRSVSSTPSTSGIREGRVPIHDNRDKGRTKTRRVTFSPSTVLQQSRLPRPHTFDPTRRSGGLNRDKTNPHTG